MAGIGTTRNSSFTLIGQKVNQPVQEYVVQHLWREFEDSSLDPWIGYIRCNSSIPGKSITINCHQMYAQDSASF